MRSFSDAESLVIAHGTSRALTSPDRSFTWAIDAQGAERVAVEQMRRVGHPLKCGFACRVTTGMRRAPFSAAFLHTVVVVVVDADEQ